MNDYKFNFKFYSEPLENFNFNSFLKSILCDLLEFCVLYDGDNKINVTAFELKHPGEKKVELYDDTLENITKRINNNNLTEDEKGIISTEPRIYYIINLIKNVQRLAGLYEGDRKCLINKIELHDVKNWILNEYNHASSVYQHLAYTCNANCLFCYLKANPTNIGIGKRQENCSYNELMTRINYFSREKNIFTQSFEIKEFFNSPFVKETLIALRKKTNDEFFFVTNGSLLKEDLVCFLSSVKPVTLIVSVIVTSNEMRSKIMFNSLSNEVDDLNRVTLEAFGLLKKYEIPFIPSITAWPSITYADFLETIKFLEAYDPVAIRINMLGYTDTNKPNEDISEDFWYTFCSYINAAEKETEIPLLPIPAQYYINEFQENVLDVCVLGTIKNSPARSVLRKGDKILKINGYTVTSRDQLLDALMFIQGEIRLSIKRDNDYLEVALPSDNSWKYPYLSNQYGKYTFPYGICIPESIQEKHIKQIIREIEKLEKNNDLEILLIVGPLVRKSIIAYFDRFGAYYDYNNSIIYLNDCSIRIVDSVNYYLGGNMQIMDMCVVSDIVKVILDNKTEKTKAVFLPDSMFNIWGNDLMGINKDVIEKCVKMPIKFIQSKTVPY